MKRRSGTFACKERERLEKAYQDALQAKHALEDSLGSEIVSKDRNRAKRAKKQCEVALKHAVNILEELRRHWQKHGCG